MGKKRQRRIAMESFDVVPTLHIMGQILMRRRLALGWSREHIGRQIGLSSSSIEFVEKGTVANQDHAGVSLIKLLRWITVLDLTMGDVFPPGESVHVHWFASLCSDVQAIYRLWGEKWEQLEVAKVLPMPLAPCQAADKK